jgi:hypothetical protein
MLHFINPHLLHISVLVIHDTGGVSHLNVQMFHCTSNFRQYSLHFKTILSGLFIKEVELIHSMKLMCINLHVLVTSFFCDNI